MKAVAFDRHARIEVLEYRDYADPQGYAEEDIATAVDLVAAGKLKPVVGRTFYLRETAEPVRLLEERNFFGEIVVLP